MAFTAELQYRLATFADFWRRPRSVHGHYLARTHSCSKVFDAAVAQHAEACRLLSVENLPLPPAPSQVAAAAAREKSRNIDNSSNSNGYTETKSLSGGSTATKNSQHNFASDSGHADHTKQDSRGQRETGGRPKRRLSSGSASVADMVAQARLARFDDLLQVAVYVVLVTVAGCVYDEPVPKRVQ